MLKAWKAARLSVAEVVSMWESRFSMKSIHVGLHSVHLIDMGNNDFGHCASSLR
jgi:hypothetical protein